MFEINTDNTRQISEGFAGEAESLYRLVTEITEVRTVLAGMNPMEDVIRALDTVIENVNIDRRSLYRVYDAVLDIVRTYRRTEDGILSNIDRGSALTSAFRVTAGNFVLSDHDGAGTPAQEQYYGTMSELTELFY